MTPRYCSLEVMRLVLAYANKGAMGKFDEFSGSWNEDQISMMNCDTCGHKKIPQGGHYYMFREAPPGICWQHTGYKTPITDILAYWEKPRS